MKASSRNQWTRRLMNIGRDTALILRDRQSRRALRNNILKEISHTHRLSRNLGHPQIFEIETTNACPYTCIMCPRTHAMTRPVGHMDIALFRSLVDQVRPEWQMDQLRSKPTMRLLHYGEPMVYPHYAESIEHCHSRGFSVYISTNPSVWTDKRIDETLEVGVDELFVMVDGLDDETSMAIRGKAASFTRSEANIRELARRKVQKGLRKPHITIAMIKQPRNAHQWHRFNNYWAGIDGVDAVYVAHYSTFSGDVEEINAAAAQLEGKDPSQAQQAERQRVLMQYPCYYPWHSVSVTWQGEVVPCCRDYDAKLVLGNLNDESLESIWNGSKMRRLREDFASGAALSSLCASCKEPSLEIGLPGRAYPIASWMRKMGLGKMRGAAADQRAVPLVLSGSQNINRSPLIPSSELVAEAKSIKSRTSRSQLVEMK